MKHLCNCLTTFFMKLHFSLEKIDQQTNDYFSELNIWDVLSKTKLACHLEIKTDSTLLSHEVWLSSKNLSFGKLVSATISLIASQDFCDETGATIKKCDIWWWMTKANNENIFPDLVSQCFPNIQCTLLQNLHTCSKTYMKIQDKWIDFNVS